MIDMKPLLPVLLAICCILAFSGVCGCTSTPARHSAGIQEITRPVGDTRTDLGTALEELDVLAGEGMANVTGMEVVMVSGTAANPTANASTWVLGVRQDGAPHLLVYARGSWSRLGWNGSLPDDAVSFDEIVMPGDLYRRHAATIEGLGQETDLLLENGTYVVRSHGDRPDAVTFDARTGERIA
ncbi:MAG: hypothetical protein PWP08_127 [Methanofollis sp.]|nr:hypothetical protein [Methanofollis sp.]